jgi:hypothetical protein
MAARSTVFPPGGKNVARGDLRAAHVTNFPRLKLGGGR